MTGDANPPAQKPSARFFAGIAAIALSYVVAWPAMTALGALAIYCNKPVWAAVGLPGLYGLSWIIWALGLWLAGPQSVAYARTLTRRFAARLRRR